MRCWKKGRKNDLQEVKLVLNSMDKVKKFVQTITKFDGEFDMVSGKYVVDAKSIMGIFSVDLSKPVVLQIHAEENEEDEILKAIQEFME